MKNFFKNLNYRHYICCGITIGFILISAFCFPYAFPRLGESFRDFGLSIAYHYTELFGFEGLISPTVTSLSEMPFTMPYFFPETWEEFTIKWKLYWNAFADGNNFINYILSSRGFMKILARILTLALPIIFIFILLIRTIISKKNVRHNQDTKPLIIFKKLSDKVYRPTKKFICEFIDFVKNYSKELPLLRKPKPGDIVEPTEIKYYQLWAFIWLLNFNILTVLIEFLSFYFYFVISFDFINIYGQVYKLLLDLSVIIEFVPIPLWIVFGMWVVDKIRKKIGDDVLWHHELMNRGFINERGVFTLITAPMRGGKNKLEVSFTLSREVMFIDNAYKIILKSDLKFPYFPWIIFEKSLQRAMAKGSVYNLATCRRFVFSKMQKFYKRPLKRNLWGYDFEKYPMDYDNAKYIETLEEVLSNYAQAYFIYVEKTSLIISNYSIRVDTLLDTIGNFPLRNTDFFKRDSKLVDSMSRHSHILNFDVLRLGKKVAEESGFAFEFGIIDITEIGKDRLNMVESMELKKDDKETNQKNDGFDDWVKMCGHNATIDYQCFVSIYADEQRDENLPASLRQVGEIIQIDENEKGLLAMPLFFVEELLHSFLSSKFMDLHKEIRYNRGDNTLLYHIIHTIVSKFESYYDRIYGQYGYEKMKVLVMDGKKEKEAKTHKIFISNKKDLSKRYSTDCLSELLTVRALRAIWGLSKEPEYEKDRATLEELKKQNSYFITRTVDLLSDKKKFSKAPIKNSAPEKWMQFINAKK